ALLAIEDDEPPSDIADLVARREALHRALVFGRIVAQLVAGAAVAIALWTSGWVPARYLVPLVVGLGVVVVIVSEVSAREAGDLAGAAGVRRVRSLIEGVEALCAPVVAFGRWGDRLLEQWMPTTRVADEAQREDAVERFRDVVAAGVEAEGGDGVLVHGVFSLAETRVAEIMVPRVDIVGIDQETPWSEVADRIRSAQHSRLVVYRETIDDVVGVLHAKDLLGALVAGAEPAGGWQAVVRSALFIPATNSVERQLRDFRASRRHLAVVIDEFGGTAGIVTLEDALELIVGDIQDEGDAEIPDVERADGGRLWVAAGVSLDTLSELLDADVTRDDVATVGGLVMALLGRVPKPGEALDVAGHRLVVERVVRRRVERVYLEPLDVPVAATVPS
ncbi:MAG: hemolysin family protein, partial [Gemmatimonadota bacterium]|nr:hemolysin family protein [Gemmatimonadota bacterium]